MNRRLVLLLGASLCLTSCMFASNRRRVGKYHALRYVDGSIMLLYLLEDGKINGSGCGVDFYNRYTEKRQSVTPMNYGVTKKYIVIETNAVEMERWWLVQNESEARSTRLGPFTKREVQDLLVEDKVEWPKLKAA